MMNKGVYCHPHALCESEKVGEGTRIWAFAHVLPGAIVGSGCNICDGVYIENDVVVGDDVTVKCGVQLWDGVRLGNGVFVGPNATFTNDLMPRSKVYPDAFLETVVEDDASIGANATILPGIRVGYKSMVGAGAVVTRDVPPYAKVNGNPARIVGYLTGEQAHARDADALVPPGVLECGGRNKLPIGGCFLERLPHFADMRGSLTPLEEGNGFPFAPVRIFVVHSVDNAKVRGEHAHKVCKQFLVAVAGSLSVVLDDGHRRIEVELNEPNLGLYLAPMVWGVQYKFTPDAVLMVAASHKYDKDDYIRDYSDFRVAVGA